jgi:hypothetical protein
MAQVTVVSVLRNYRKIFEFGVYNRHKTYKNNNNNNENVSV